MAAKRPEDLLFCHCGTTELQEKQVLRSLRSHQDDNVYLKDDEIIRANANPSAGVYRLVVARGL